MRSEYNMSDQLAIDIDCPPLGTSTCPSISSFFPIESPTSTPPSLFSQGSLASPGWHEGHAFSGYGEEARRTSTPLRSSFRMDIMAGDRMSMHYKGAEGYDRVPILDYVPTYADNIEQFWIPQDTPKSYEQSNSFACQPTRAPQYPQIVQNCYCSNHAAQLPESVSNPCLSSPIFPQTKQLASSMLMPWMLSADATSPRTITPAQLFPETPVILPPSYLGFPGSVSMLRTHNPMTAVQSNSLGTTRTENLTHLSSGPSNHKDKEFMLSPGVRDICDTSRHRHQHQLSRKLAKEQSSKQSLRLKGLPSIIKRTQFRCKELGCEGRFKRQEHLKRHVKIHSKEKPHVCWVPGCSRRFSRRDNLKVHCTKTHSKRGGRNRYVATLDPTSPHYDFNFRGQLTPDGCPIYGPKLDCVIPTDSQDMDAE